MLMIKRYGVWIGLALTLLTTYWTSKQEDVEQEVLLVVAQSQQDNRAVMAPQKPSDVATEAKPLVLMQRLQFDNTPINLFSTFTNSQILVTNEEVIQAPQTPANPYSYAGKVVEDGQVSVFLTDGTNNYVVKAGDVIDGVWQVQAIRPPQLILKYLPLKTEVKIEIGALG